MFSETGGYFSLVGERMGLFLRIKNKTLILKFHNREWSANSACNEFCAGMHWKAHFDDGVNT